METINTESFCFISMLDLLPRISLQDSIKISKKYSSMYNLCKSLETNSFANKEYESYLQSHLNNDSIHYQLMLCYIPNVGMIEASKISEYFPTMIELCNSFKITNPEMLSNIVGKQLSITIYEYLFTTM